jgi:agmatinase
MSEASLFQSAWNFLGLPDELASPERAKAWVLPVPYEATTSYGANTRNGPAAIIAASRAIERFDCEFDCEPAARFGVHTLSPLAPVRRSPEAMIDAVQAAVAGVLSGSPAPELLAVLGGEHTISAGVVRGLAEARDRTGGTPENLVAVQIDAHADLWDQYEGSPYSHACAARRIVETCPVFQIGIRSMSEAERRFQQQSDRVHTVFAEDAVERTEFLDDLARFVRGKTVFLTIDLDGLDPSIMPAVGTPEPGGISWARTLEVVRVICREAASLPVFDVVELAPIAGMAAPDFLAARLAYKIMSWAFCGRNGVTG